MPFIVFETGQNTGNRVEVKGTVMLGRIATWGGIAVNDSLASREHMKIVREADGYYAEDLKSKNGTSVNGSHITRIKLKNGDKIVIGRTMLRFEDTP